MTNCWRVVFLSEETEKIVDLLERDALEPSSIKELIIAHLEVPADEDDIKKDIAHSLQERLPGILGTGTQKARVVVLKQNWLKYVAAIIIIIIGAAVYLLQPENKSPVAANEDNNGKPVIRPGKDRAVLTLADGKEIFLDSTQGDILQENDFSVVNKNGELDYEGNMNKVEQHLLSTPRGGQYQLKLPDGTKVWMNAESSITFPTAFTGNAIVKVSIKGEVYFEVKVNMNKPFIVEVNRNNCNPGFRNQF